MFKTNLNYLKLKIGIWFCCVSAPGHDVGPNCGFQYCINKLLTNNFESWQIRPSSKKLDQISFINILYYMRMIHQYISIMILKKVVYEDY